MAPVATYFTINESTNSTTSNSSSTIHVKAMDTIHYTLYYGTFIHTPELNELEINFNTLVGVNSEGIIDFIEKNIIQIIIIINHQLNILLIVTIMMMTMITHKVDAEVEVEEIIDILNLLIIHMI